jgi:hypothetical protein
MVLAESHYNGPKDGSQPKGNHQDFTTKVVGGIVERNDKGWRTRLFVKVSRLILRALRADHEKEDWRELWNSLLFYNFVQSRLINNVRHRPTDGDWKTGEEALPEVLQRHKPNLVLVLGVELAKYAVPIIKKSRPQIRSVPIRHPSSFGWKYEADWVNDLGKAMRQASRGAASVRS